jgi:exopolysaccharide production protein ExoZ
MTRQDPGDRHADTTKQVVGIQYLRGIAACAVVLDHAASMAALDKYFAVPLFSGSLSYSSFGVDLFFVISGVIIALISLEARTIAPQIAVGQFFTRRFIRIVPLMWLAILSYAGLRFLGRNGIFPSGDYVRALVLWPVGGVEPNVIWTLRHEMLFYIVFSLTWLMRRDVARPALILWFAAPLLLAALPFQDYPELLRFVFSPVNIEFGLGFALCLLYLCYPRVSIPIRGQYTVMVAMMGVIALVGYSLDLRLVQIKTSFIIGAMSVVAVAFGLFFRPQKVWRFGVLLGDASYSIYLFHPHIVSATLGLLRKLVPVLDPHAAFAAAAVAGITGGLLVHRLVERPLLGIAHRLLRWRVAYREQPAAAQAELPDKTDRTRLADAQQRRRHRSL